MTTRTTRSPILVRRPPGREIKWLAFTRFAGDAAPAKPLPPRVPRGYDVVVLEGHPGFSRTGYPVDTDFYVKLLERAGFRVKTPERTQGALHFNAEEELIFATILLFTTTALATGVGTLLAMAIDAIVKKHLESHFGPDEGKRANALIRRMREDRRLSATERRKSIAAVHATVRDSHGLRPHLFLRIGQQERDGAKRWFEADGPPEEVLRGFRRWLKDSGYPERPAQSPRKGSRKGRK